MSLAIIAADSVQAIAVSEGRAFTFFGEKKKLLRDDVSKVFQVAPRICVAATNQGYPMLLEAVRDFVSSYRGTDRLFKDVVEFTTDWLHHHPLAMRVAVFGWDDRLELMRVVAMIQPETWTCTEVLPSGDHLPVYAAMGESESLVDLTPEKLAVEDPMRLLRETLASVSARNSDVGERTFEYLIQAPEDVLRTSATHPGRVWPTFDPSEFADRLKANPPADIDTLEFHVRARLLLHSAATGIPMDALCRVDEAKFPHASACPMR